MNSTDTRFPYALFEGCPKTALDVVKAAHAKGWTVETDGITHDDYGTPSLTIRLSAGTSDGPRDYLAKWEQKKGRLAYNAQHSYAYHLSGATSKQGFTPRHGDLLADIRAHAATAPEDPSSQIAPEMVENEDDISEPNTPAGRQAWSVVKLSRDAQKYAEQSTEHANEAERLELETACYADIAEVSRTERACAEQISEAKRHAALIAPEVVEAERLYRRARWAHAAAYRISSILFFSDGPWDAVMDDWTERSADAKASGLEACDRAQGAAQDAAEHVDRAERQLDRACKLCGAWYPCTRDGRTLTADLYDRGGYTCRCGGDVEDVEERGEAGPGQMSFDDVPEPEHETAVTELDGEFIPSCVCGWTQTTGVVHREEFARMRASLHRRNPWADLERVAEQTAPETTKQEEESTVGRGSMAPKRKAAVPKVGDIVFSGEKGRERAELLGHAYRVAMLAGMYFVTHIASGVEIMKEITKRAEMKRLLLADAVARGEDVEEDQEQPEPVAEERKPVTHADLMAVDGAELVALLDSLSEEQRQELAGEWPVRWLYPRKEGERPRGINFCAGCGGGCKGKRLVSDSDMVCVDLAGDAVATSEAAGCTVIRADVKTLSPEHPALRWTEETTFTMPCTDWTDAGTRRGRDLDNLEILTEAINVVGFAYGNYEKDGTEYCDHEETGEECTWEEGCFSSYGDRTDMTVPEMWALVEPLTTKPMTCGLMLAPVIWCLGLRYIGAPLVRVVIEQAAALPEEIKDDIWLELSVAGCEQGEWTVLDAADFGSPSTRKRSIMAAHWYRRPGLPTAPGITTLAYEAIGWAADDEVNTRGERKTSGGNNFRMDGTNSRQREPKPINGITSKIRGWYNAATGRRFTIEEVCLLVGLPADYPVAGSRTSQCQQLGDIFSPLVSLAVWGQLLGVAWREMLRGYLAELYPAVHGGADTAEIQVEDSPAGIDQEIPPADTEESAEEWSYENERNPRPGCGSFPKPCNHAWPCGRDAVAWNKQQGKERAERAASTPGAKRTEGESRTYAGASDDGYGHNFERMAYDWEIAEGRFRTTSNDLGDKHRFHGEKPKGDNGWTISVRCLHESCKGKVIKSVDYEAEALLAMRAHGKKKHPAPVAPKAGEPGFMAALLEKHVGPDWKPLEATADPEFVEDQEEPQRYQGIAPVSREQRRAALRIVAGEKKPEVPAGESVEENPAADKPEISVTPLDACGVAVSLGRGLGFVDLTAPAIEAAPVRQMLEAAERHPIATPYTAPARTFATPYRRPQPDTGRAYWETGVRVTLNQRAGQTSTSRTGKGILVRWDDDELGTWQQPEELWLEGTEPKPEPRGWFAAKVQPAPVVEEDGPDYAAISAAHRAEREEELLAELLTEELDRPEPVVDVLAELRAELEELRLDVEEWGAEVAALAVAEAERIVAEVAADMRAAELLALREEARELRESLGWGPVVWEVVPTRARPWRSLFGLAASMAGLMAAGWSEGVEASLRQ
ncbi:hypothetical protein ACFYUL_17905 [Streptomyces sp. NPDC004311]|uniref:hypothetical protein n=1 Tax=Streptomyces sp. NPDC004311 TaxID=3364698 RepID=UPI00368D0E68